MIQHEHTGKKSGGSSRYQEMKGRRDAAVRVFRSVKDVPENSKMESSYDEFKLGQQLDDEGRWLDDGGESGTLI